MKLPVTVFFSIFFAFAITAQNIELLKGKVLDKSTLQPIPFANVYINNTSIGTMTNEIGEFSLRVHSIQNIKLIVSSVGFKPLEKSIVAGENTIELEPDNTLLSEIKVSSKKDKKWNSLYKDFEKVFFGTSEAAKFCKISSPWQIDLSKVNNVLIAKTDQPIEITNNYLGYKVIWYLKSFESSPQSFSISGNSRFVLLKAKNIKEANYWLQNRDNAYTGSLEHFLKSLYNGSSEKEGYKIYQETLTGKGKNRNQNFSNELNIKKTVKEIPVQNLIICQNKKCYLNFENQIEVHFTNKIENKPKYIDIPYQVSWLDGVEKKVSIDSLGHLEKMGNILISGSMTEGRIAELLPLDFQLKDYSKPKFPQKYLQETVKLQTQKAYYFPSERVWIKASMYYENQLFRDSLNKILYVDLINPQKKIVTSQQWEIYYGEANGDILLPDSLQTGIYYLRAYTNWMRNYGDSTIFYKTLPVINKNQRIDLPNQTEILSERLSVKFNKEQIFVSDSLDITIEGYPFHSYSVSIVNDLSGASYDTASTIFSQKNLTEIKFPAEKSFTLRGITKDDKNKGTFSKIAILNKLNNELAELETDKLGNFSLENIWGIDTLKYLMKATDLKGKKIRKIEILQKNIPDIKIPVLQEIKILNNSENKYITNDIERNENATLLNTVTVKAKKENADLIERSKLYSRADFVVNATEFLNRVADENLITFLRGRVPGMNIETISRDGIIQYRIRVRGRSGMDQFSNASEYEPLILLDGIPTDISVLSIMNASQIDRIEVITRIEAMFGARGANGVIAIYSAKNATNNKNLPQNETLKNFQQINIPAINRPNIFIQNLKNQSTLYWNPYVFTDELGKATIKISVGNSGQNRIIQVSGTNRNGKPSFAQKLFRVNGL